MNSAIELHDSEVTSVARDGQVVRVALEPAYVHRSTGRPGIDAGEGYLQAADLFFSGATGFEEEGICRGTVSDGYVSAGEREFANVVPLPFLFRGEISATFHFVSGGVLRIRASEVSCVLRGAARFVEAYEG
jgi:hypothetical protein